MNGKLLGIFATTLVTSSLFAGSALAGLVKYEFTFTGADLLGYELAKGAKGNTAVESRLYDGAALLAFGSDATHKKAAASYVKKDHKKFERRWNNLADRGFVLDTFNLWGLDGKGANWGEDFKPYEWSGMEGPDGWAYGLVDYKDTTWGDPPGEALTTLFPAWGGGPDYGLAMNDKDLGDKKFSFYLTFEEEDMWWGQGTGDAPNALPELTFWFGGYLTKYNKRGDIINEHFYQGNMVLTGVSTPVPEPGTVLLFGAGLLGLAGVARRKRQ